MKFVKETMLMTLSMSTFVLSWRVPRFLDTGKKVYNFYDILDEVKGFASNQRSVISEIAQIGKLLYVNQIVAAAGHSQLHGDCCEQR